VKEQLLELQAEVDETKQYNNALEARYKTLLQKAEEKCVQAENENAEWKSKVLDVEFQLSAKDDEISVWEQKFHLETMRIKTMEEKMLAMEEELEDRMGKHVRDSERIYTLKKENKKLKLEIQKSKEETKEKPESRTSRAEFPKFDVAKSEGKLESFRKARAKSKLEIEEFNEDPESGKVKTKSAPKNFSVSSRPSSQRTLTNSSRDDPTKMEEVQLLAPNSILKFTFL